MPSSRPPDEQLTGCPGVCPTRRGPIALIQGPAQLRMKVVPLPGDDAALNQATVRRNLSILRPGRAGRVGDVVGLGRRLPHVDGPKTLLNPIEQAGGARRLVAPST